MVEMYQKNSISYIVCACGRHFHNDDDGYRFHVANCEPSVRKAAEIRASRFAQAYQGALRAQIDAKTRGK